MRENNRELVKGLVSVVIPTYNRKELVMRAIRSVITQTYHDIEVIVVDDGSTDGTEEIIKAFQQESGEERIHYYFQSNQGVSSARNYGMTLARGEYLQFLDSDDYFLPNKIEVQVESLNQNNADVSVCSVEKKSPPLRKVTEHWSNEDIHKRLIKMQYVGIGAVLFRRTAMVPDLNFRVGCNFSEDFEFLFLNFLKFKKYVTCPEELLIYDIRDDDQLTNRPVMTVEEYRESFWYLQRYIWSHEKHILPENNWLISRLYQRFSRIFFDSHDYFECGVSLIVAVIKDPTRIISRFKISCL